MKKHLTLLTLGAFFLFASSNVTAQMRFGASAGFNAANVDYRVHPDLRPKMTPSFHVGAVVELPLPVDFLYLDIGLEAQGKGYQFVSDSTDHKLSATVNPLYIQVPAKLMVRSNDVGVFGGIGTYLAYGIAGKVKQVEETFATEKTVTTNESVRYGNKDQDHFRPLDYGFSLELGYEFNIGLRISGAYSWGFGDGRKQPIKDIKFISPVNHRVASLSLTYFFITKRQ